MNRPLTTMVLLGALLVFQGTVNATPITENVVSNGSWRSHNTFFAGWETIGFDDSAWSFARAPYPSPTPPQTLFGPTTAQHMWHDPAGASDGTNGPVEAFFRFSFNLDIQSNSLPLVGQALIAVDDDYDFFVNGVLVKMNHDGGFADVVDFVDFTSFLQDGVNLFAIQARDGAWETPFNRIFERVLFDARIATLAPVSEPPAFGLLVIGLAALGLLRWRLSGR